MKDTFVNIKYWITAIRVRTLLLAVSCILLGTFLARSENLLNPRTVILCFSTAIFLQILTNFANDCGDFINGADTDSRNGPERVIATGKISLSDMKKGVLLFTILSAISGLLLIIHENLLIFIPLGILAIIAAITYTMGFKPYAYIGLGDFFVFIFFGLVGVMGSYYLQAHTFNLEVVLPAISCACFSTGVLNINNIRDMKTDKIANKITIPIRIGLKNAKIYHLSLLIIGYLSSLLFVILNYRNMGQLLILVSLPFFIKNGIGVLKNNDEGLDPYLRQMSISTLVYVITFGIGINL